MILARRRCTLLFSLLASLPALAQQPPAPHLTPSEAIRNLPQYLAPGTELPYSEALNQATLAERDAAIPRLVQWLSDERPRVRGLALLSIYLLSLPGEHRPQTAATFSIPVQYIPAIVSRLRDPDPSVRKVALVAVLPIEYSGGAGMEELVNLVLPMLREPDILTEYPDPFFIESDRRMLASMTPEQQAAFKAHPHKIFTLPAEGPDLLAILAMPTRQPSPAVDDAMIAFLDRPDQTQSTLSDCLHHLALAAAGDRVNDEALRRVFEQNAMTVFLLQFLTNLRLTPAQFTAQHARLVALSNDQAATPVLRHAAQTVAACWTGDRHVHCSPTPDDFREANNPPTTPAPPKP